MSEQRLIDANALKEMPITIGYIGEKTVGAIEEATIKAVFNNIDSAPTIDPETLGYRKVVRGRYITDDMGDSKCSVCGENYLDCTKNYCPNCAAQMDAEGGEG